MSSDTPSATHSETTTKPCTLNSLPGELRNHIVSYVSDSDLHGLATTCKLWRAELMADTIHTLTLTIINTNTSITTPVTLRTVLARKPGGTFTYSTKVRRREFHLDELKEELRASVHKALKDVRGKEPSQLQFTAAGTFSDVRQAELWKKREGEVFEVFTNAYLTSPITVDTSH